MQQKRYVAGHVSQNILEMGQGKVGFQDEQHWWRFQSPWVGCDGLNWIELNWFIKNELAFWIFNVKQFNLSQDQHE